MCSKEKNPSMNNKRRLRVPKSRTTPKKPKFLSLRRQFPPCGGKERGDLTPMQQSSASAGKGTSHQLNLFPLQPQSLIENQEHENVAFFFSSDGGDASLTGLLDHTAESNSSHASDHSRPDDLSPSVSLTYTDRVQDSEERSALVRNALRSRERESSEEKWVCYSEVVERKVKEEEVSSTVVDLWRPGEDHAPLSLKLDYDDVVKAWSGRGPLYINHAETAQIVPDVTDDVFPSSNGVKRGDSNVGWWAVPEMGEEEVRMKMGQREASLLRYKAKRQNRLFSKKIRYQVRKLNAEKRPRLKGRFVKRD